VVNRTIQSKTDLGGSTCDAWGERSGDAVVEHREACSGQAHLLAPDVEILQAAPLGANVPLKRLLLLTSEVSAWF
jgi:hypothetical protein